MKNALVSAFLAVVVLFASVAHATLVYNGIPYGSWWIVTPLPNYQPAGVCGTSGG